MSFIFLIPGLLFILLGRAVALNKSVRLMNDTDFNEPELAPPPFSSTTLIGEYENLANLFLIRKLCFSNWGDSNCGCAHLG